MSRALELAALGLNTTDPNPRVGAVLARGQEVIGEGWHQRAGEPHAEVFALRAAGERARGATLYVTLEPCSHQGRTPPCADAIVAAGVARVVIAMADPNPRVNGAGSAKLRAGGVDVQSGLLEEQARELNPGFAQRMSRGLPWVRLKLGASLDGRIALPSGESRWITGEESRADVQRWRARSSAIVTSHATVLRDDPRLDVRLEGATRQPLRVILDGNLETPAVARILDKPGDVLIFTSAQGSLSRAALESRGARVEAIGRSVSGGVDLSAVLARLAREGMNEVWIECGSRLAGAFVHDGLVDELIVYQAPVLLGSEAFGMFHLPAPVALAQAQRWRFTDVRSIGADVRLIARPQRENA